MMDTKEHPPKKHNVLVIGSGGREHAFVHCLAGDPALNRLFCAPGNGGTFTVATNVQLDVMDNDAVVAFVRERAIDFTIIGPEAPLANGLVDAMQAAGQLVFGPTGYAAQLESSKLFAREVMAAAGVPQPQYIACHSLVEAQAAWQQLGAPLVVKADGLAAGKGVLICEDENSYNSAVEQMFTEKRFGTAGDHVSVERCLVGEELSVFAVCDGENYFILNSAQDHKRAYDGDLGPNTGGMGAYSPTPLSTPELLERVGREIIAPTLKEMKNREHPYKGFLYAGIMLVEGNPFVIEFNVRMGDPEAQVILPLLKTSLFDLLHRSACGELDQLDFQIDPRTAVTVVLAAEGYPESYPKGMEIFGLDKLEGDLVFHAGTIRDGNRIRTSGGRVLNIVGFGPDLTAAIKEAYRIVDQIHFDHMAHRYDIGQRGLAYLKSND